jgi:hypothetical protein
MKRTDQRRTIDAVGRVLASVNYACSMGDLPADARAGIVRLAMTWPDQATWLETVEGAAKALNVDPKIHRFRGFA